MNIWVRSKYTAHTHTHTEREGKVRKGRRGKGGKQEEMQKGRRTEKQGFEPAAATTAAAEATLVNLMQKHLRATPVLQNQRVSLHRPNRQLYLLAVRHCKPPYACEVPP